MSGSIRFNTDELEKGSQYYSKVHLAPEQEEIVNDMAMLLLRFTDFPKFALHGFIWLAMKDWQQIHHMDVANLIKMPWPERKDHVLQIAEFFKHEMKRTIEWEGDKKVLEEGIDKAMQFYIETYAHRLDSN